MTRSSEHRRLDNNEPKPPKGGHGQGGNLPSDDGKPTERRKNMERLKIMSEVIIFGLKSRYEYVEEFDDNENVFGRILKYHQHMEETFPNKEWRLVKVERLEPIGKEKKQLCTM